MTVTATATPAVWFTIEQACKMTQAQATKALPTFKPSWDLSKANGQAPAYGFKVQTILKAKANGWSVKHDSTTGTLVFTKAKRMLTVSYYRAGKTFIQECKQDSLILTPTTKDRLGKLGKHLATT